MVPVIAEEDSSGSDRSVLQNFVDRLNCFRASQGPERRRKEWPP